MIKLGKREGWEISYTGFRPEDAGLTADQTVLFDQILAWETKQEKGKPVINFILVYNGDTELDLTGYNNIPIGTEIRTPNLAGVFSYYHHKKSTIPSASDWTTKLEELKGIVLQKSSNILSFTTIRAALDDAEPGDIIKLEAKIYNEDVVVEKNEITIIGTDREKTVINGLTITGKNISIKNLTLNGDLTFLSLHSFIPFYGNKLSFCNIYGNVYLGTETEINRYQILIDNCWFKGINKEFIINSIPDQIEWGWSPFITNSIIRNENGEWHPTLGTYALTIYSGSAYFLHCSVLYITSVAYEGAARLRFDNCFNVEIQEMGFNYDGTGLPEGQGHMVFNLEKSGFYYGWNNPLTMRYKTEFNLIHSFFFTNGTAINFNSVAMSRWLYTTQKVFGSTTTLGGTGLANLHVYNCIWRFADPTGLAANVNNAWGVVIDY